MKAVWVLAKKELRLMVRDRLSAGLLLALPLLFILMLGLLLGESFGQKPDDTLRISIVDLDAGPGAIPNPPTLVHITTWSLLASGDGCGSWRATPVAMLAPDWRIYPIPNPDRLLPAFTSAFAAIPAGQTGPVLAAASVHPHWIAYRRWADIVTTDLRETPGIRLEIIQDRAQAETLIREHRRSAVLVLRRDFSDRIDRCSFLATPFSVNPFHREGVHLRPNRVDLGVELLRDPTQAASAAIIEQVVQVSMLRVLLPYMIGQAFQKLSEPRFIDKLGDEVRLPLPADFKVLAGSAQSLLKDSRVRIARLTDRKLDAQLTLMESKLKNFQPILESERVTLSRLIDLAAGKNYDDGQHFRNSVGEGVQGALRHQFRKYDLTGMTWAALTRSRAERDGAKVSDFADREGSGVLRRGAARYQTIVPMYTVMFSFFLVLIVGWVFVAERRQGTLNRLRTAPLWRWQVLAGKLVPCYAVSLGQGVLLFVAGRLLFGMQWGPAAWPWYQQVGWLLAVIACTSFAAMGLAMLIASLARSESQVSLFGGVPTMVMAIIGGCVLPREMMPETTQELSTLVPHGWALAAYRELLITDAGYVPNMGIVVKACGVLLAFGAGFLALAWGLLRLD